MKLTPAIAALLLIAPALLAAEPAIVQQIHDQIKETGSAAVSRGFHVSRSPLVIRRKVGVGVSGAGSHTHPPESDKGWNLPDAVQGTWIDFDLPPDQPAVVIEDCLNVTFRDLAIRHMNGGPVLAARTDKWRGNNHHSFDNVRFVATEGGVGVVCGGGKVPHNSSDLNFKDCEFVGKAGSTGFKLLDWQNVGYNLNGCSFYGTETILHIVRGGNVRFYGCDANSGIKTVARIDSSGPNVSPAVAIYGMRIDRSGTTQRPVVFDASRLAESGTKVLANTVSVIRRSGDREQEPTPAVLWPEKGGKLTVNAMNNSLNGVIAWDERVRDFDKAKLITGVETVGGEP